MIDSVASILAPLLGLAGSAGGDAAIAPPFLPHPTMPMAGERGIAGGPGLLPMISLASVQFAGAAIPAGASMILSGPAEDTGPSAVWTQLVLPLEPVTPAAPAAAATEKSERPAIVLTQGRGDAGSTFASAFADLAPDPSAQLAARPPVEPAPVQIAQAETAPPMPAAEAPMNARSDSDGLPAIEADDALLEGRRRPGTQKDLPERIEQMNTGAVRPPPPEAFYGKEGEDYPDGLQRNAFDVGVPDRWRIMASLCPQGGDKSIYTLYPNLRKACRPTTDPFAHNVLKGDRPLTKEQRPSFLKGEDWFFIVNAISDTIIEPRSFPIPVGNQTTELPNQVDTFGRGHSTVVAQTFITGVSLLKGMTAYKPPAIEYRLTLATQVNYVNVPERRVLSVRPSKESQRLDHFVGVQEAFIDYHLSQFDNSRYDFFSVRAGIQPIQQDFRGFLFQDNQLGVRLFGNRDNNRFQFNLAAFWRLEKDTNSGLNSIVQRPRDDWVFMANVFRQDFPVVGLTSQVSVTYNMNREANNVEIDDNGFPARPALIGDLRGREYDVVYVGYGADGRVGRINLTGQLYGAFGEDRNSIFTSQPAKIAAYFAAAEVSYDVDWLRFRLSGLYASGDKNPYNNTEAGFSAIFENPIFAGADTSYRIRQSIPFAGGGRAIVLNGRNAILNDVRSSKEQGQSNFNNPGTVLLGAGVDADITPKFRLSGNVNHLWFANTATLQALRVEGSIPKSMGWDVSAAAIWRPLASQNIVGRLSAAVFQPSKGFDDLFAQQGKESRFFSVLANIILAF